MEIRIVCKRDLLRAEIDRVAAGVRQCQLEASRLAQLYVLACHEANAPMCDLGKQNFWAKCISAVIGRSSSTTGRISATSCTSTTHGERAMEALTQSTCTAQARAQTSSLLRW